VPTGRCAGSCSPELRSGLGRLVARSRRPSSSRPATFPSRGASARLATLHIGRPFLRRRRAVIRAGLCPCPLRDSTRKDLRFAQDAVHVRAALGACSFHHPSPVGRGLVRILHDPLGLALDAVPLLRRRTWRCSPRLSGLTCPAPRVGRYLLSSVLPYVVLLLQVLLCRARVPALRTEPLEHVDQTLGPMTYTMILV